MRGRRLLLVGLVAAALLAVPPAAADSTDRHRAPAVGNSTATGITSANVTVDKAEVLRLIESSDPAAVSAAKAQAVAHWVATHGPDALSKAQYQAARTWVQQAIATHASVDLDVQLPAVPDLQFGDTGPADTGLTYDQLSPRGHRPSPAVPPSVRAFGPYSSAALKKLPSNFWSMALSGRNSPFWRYTSPGATVQRNKLKFVTKRPRSMDGVFIEPKNYTIRVAYWESETRLVDRGNSTQQVTVATNVTTVSQTVTMGDGTDTAIIPLKPHYDDATEVTVCVEPPEASGNCLQNPDAARWRLTHASNPAYEVLPATSKGSRTVYAFGLVIVTALVTIVTLWLVRRLINRALARPNVSWFWWLIGGVVSLIATLLLWPHLVEMFVRRPPIISIPIGGLLGIIVAEWFGDATYLAAALRWRPGETSDAGYDPEADANAADGDVAADGGTPAATDEQGTLSMDIVPIRLVDSEQGRTRVTRGLRSFIARARGARTEVEFDGSPTTSIDVSHGPYEEAFWLDPDADVAMRDRPEGHTIDLPAPIEPETVETDDDETTRWNVNLRPYILGGGALAFSWLAGHVVFANGLLGLLVGALLVFVVGVLEPEAGETYLNLAPMHYHKAVGTMLKHADVLGDSRSWETLYHELTGEKARNKAEAKQLQDAGARTQAERVSEVVLGEAEYQPDDGDEDGHREVSDDA